ncbi:hypothetical protein M9H77_31780 [Catharanthus roseus]|uniref:Uncharacterized protein n=1 Tax=Catharanthus roseus TaxID=4058 RepID=A0ACC0A5A0_CATRO|nr:hypothetical protein M9H77_31780 [Catharanthus roseus]
MTKSCEELDLPQTVVPAPTVSDRFLDGTSFEDHTLPRPRFEESYRELSEECLENARWINNPCLQGIHTISIMVVAMESMLMEETTGHGNFTPRRYNEVGIFSSYAKSYGHTSYEDYGGYNRDNVSYDYYEHSPYIVMKSIIIVMTISLFPSNSYLSFEIYFKEIKFVSLAFMENGYQFFFLNSFGTLLEKRQYLEFNTLSYVIPRVDEYYYNVANYASCMLGMEKCSILQELPTSLSLNPSLMCYEVSLVELEFLLKSYLSHVSIHGDLGAISFGGGLFLVVSYTSTCLSSHAFLEDSLLHSGSLCLILLAIISEL